MKKIEAGMQFKNGDDVFTVFCRDENNKDIWFCKHPVLLGDWGFEEKEILNNLTEQEERKVA